MPAAPKAASASPLNIASLQKRSDFLRVSARNQKWSTPNFLLLTAPNPTENAAGVRVGFTVTKKLGKAVIRNRIRRRLREAFREGAAENARAGNDYVLIARSSALQCPFDALLRDIRWALTRIHQEKKP